MMTSLNAANGTLEPGGQQGPFDPRGTWPGDGHVADFTLRQIERALRNRVRYRYVKPHIVRVPDGYRIESPCCSRNVDPHGRLIDIAWLALDRERVWHLHARNHASHRWVPQCESTDLLTLLDLLCVDATRVFWP